MTQGYRYRPALFFGLAYAVAWFSWAAAAYAESRPDVSPYVSLFSLAGLLGPVGAGLVLTFGSGSAALKRDFVERLFDLRRIRPLYAVLAVAMPFTVIGAGILLSLGLGQPVDQFRPASGAGIVPLIVLALVLAPICEEMGWHGYGVDSLTAKHPMMTATLLFALLWCAWHAPLVLIPGTYQHALAIMNNKIYVANFFVSIIPAAIIANWFYYRTERSIAAAILFHSMLNAASVLIAAGQVAKVIATVLYLAIAAVLVFGDRGLFAQGPRNFVDAR
jgi:membrane protease YdiL (CAAX protease family)